MATDIPQIVYRLHSNISLPLEDAYECFESVELPDEIDEIQVQRRKNRLLVDYLERRL